MKQIIFILSFLITSLCNAQEVVKRDTLLDKEQRKVLLNREFTSALSDIPNNYIGNFANVNVTNTSASFTSSFVRDGSVFGFNVSGGTSDGTLRFINNNRLNYNFKVGAQYHFIDVSKKFKVFLDVESADSYEYDLQKIRIDAKKKIRAIETEGNLKSLRANRQKQSMVLKKLEEDASYLSKQTDKGSIKRIWEIENRISIIEARLIVAKSYVDFRRGTDSTYYYKKQYKLNQMTPCFTENCIKKYNDLNKDIAVRQTLIEKENLKKGKKDLEEIQKGITLESETQRYEQEISKLEEDIALIDEEINGVVENKGFLGTLARTKRQQDIKKRKAKGINTYGSAFSWFSIGANVNFNNFVLFDQEQPLEEQFNAQEAANYELILQYSWHRQHQLESWNSYLFNLGAAITYGDNLNTLSPRTIEDTSVLTTEDNVSRVIRNETNVFVGDYQDDIAGMRLYTDAYYFLFKGNFAAFHAYPNVILRQNQKPVFNTEVGLILSFKNQTKTNAVVNAELFYAFNDIGNSIQSGFGLLERNTIGLRLTLPITFKFQPLK